MKFLEKQRTTRHFEDLHTQLAGICNLCPFYYQAQPLIALSYD
jgi:hypothetical protein